VNSRAAAVAAAAAAAAVVTPRILVAGRDDPILCAALRCADIAVRSTAGYAV